MTTSMREAEPVAWLRDLQPDAEDEALAVCNRIDAGAFPVYTSPRLDRERLARIIDPAAFEMDHWGIFKSSYPARNVAYEKADAIMRETR